MTGRHGAGNGQKIKYNSHYETLRLNSRCRGIFIIMLTYYIYFLPVPTAVPVRVFHPLHPVHRFHGGLPLKPQPPKPLRGFPPVPTRCKALAQGKAALRPAAAATRQPPNGRMQGFAAGVPPPMIAAPQASRLLLAGPPLPLKALHFRRLSLCAVPCIAPQVGGLP